MTIGSIPRGRKQIYDRKPATDKVSSDPINNIIIMIGAERSCRYIRRVTFIEDNVSICLFSNSQIDFISNNCLTSSIEQQAIHVDMTFDLADMYAVVVTTRCPMFQGDPIFIGPIMLTKRHRAQDYATLWEELSSKVAMLKDEALVFVTDGEESITKSIKSHFGSATLYRCVNHLIDNVRRKALEFGIPAQLIKVIIENTKDQFDSCPELFLQDAEQHYKDWNVMAERLGCVTPTEKFLAYYKRTVSPVIGQNLRRNIIAAGFEGPFTNNAAESCNAIIKRQCGKKQPVDSLVIQLKELVNSQEEELRKGLKGVSQKFILKSEYQPNSLERQTLETTESSRYVIIKYCKHSGIYVPDNIN